jgi:hypothetical protein
MFVSATSVVSVCILTHGTQTNRHRLSLSVHLVLLSVISRALSASLITAHIIFAP